MNRPFILPPLSGDELLELQRLLRTSKTPAGLYKRCLLIWELAAGYNIRESGQMANLHYTNAHKWVKRFQSEGLTGLIDRKRPGRPKIHGGQIEELVIKTATSRPPDLGLGFTTWSLVKLEKHLGQYHAIAPISRETIRRILACHGLRFLTGQTWCQSTDPEFEVKKTL
ncbi:MAG: helix-turn-helix domain-containing protein [Promethearchaeota archaeon]